MREVYKDPYAELDGSKEDTSLLEGRVYAFEKCLDLIQEVYDTCGILLFSTLDAPSIFALNDTVFV